MVVVGAGHNGLLAAIRLAQAGLEVTVLERSGTPGGAVRSVRDTLPGFVHDPCSGYFPLTHASPAFQALGLIDEIAWVNPPLVMAHPFLDGAEIALHRDVDATAASLEEAAAGAGTAWRELVTPLLTRASTVQHAALTPFPPVLPVARLAVALRRDAVELARRMVGSAASFGLDVFGDERAAAWLCGSTSHSDLTPGSAGGGAFAFFLNLLGHMTGWPSPVGGAQRLIDAMVARLDALGGKLRCHADVDAIVVAASRATGVRLAGGERVDADAVVCTLSAGPLARILPEGALPGRLHRRLRRWRYGLGTFKLDLCLSAPVPWATPAARRAAVVHVADSLPSLFRSPTQAGAGRAPDVPTMIVGQHSLHDRSRAPDGRHTLYAYTRAPQRLDVCDEAFADRMQERIEAFAPGFRDLVLARAIRSPQRLEEENASLVGGDLGGGSFEIDQQLVFRPAPELFRGRTPLRGLYLAGTSVHPGGGVHGVSGESAARMVLRDRSATRFWR
ncbi:MAG: NAD(P)/FAD-dependent oxidoreductase [Actinomycetota bacterium]|nr:NAD(P)/FAD-dependent oxidoreductase [Actinomycetota bacterium]